MADAEGRFALTQLLWVAGIVVFWALLLGLPAIALVLGVRRRRRRAHRAADVRALSTGSEKA